MDEKESGSEIKSVSDLMKIIEEYGNGAEKGWTDEEQYLFRGQSNVDYKIIPSIGRKLESCTEQIVYYEKELVDSARNAFPDVFSDDLSPLDLLSKLQHYGIPTRLLDVTINPLVALYFSCCENFDKDGELIVFKNKKGWPINAGIVNAIADMRNFTLHDFSDFIKSALEKDYFKEEKHGVRVCLEGNPNYADGWIKDCCESGFIIYRPNMTQRQMIQSGKFILFPNKYEEANNGQFKFTREIAPIEKDDEERIKHIYEVPKDSKRKILELLNRIGINEEFLFSDNIDIVCKNIANCYRNKK